MSEQRKLTDASWRLQGRLVVDTPCPVLRELSRLCSGPPTLLLRVSEVPLLLCSFPAWCSSRPRGSDCTGSGTKLRSPEEKG